MKGSNKLTVGLLLVMAGLTIARADDSIVAEYVELRSHAPGCDSACQRQTQANAVAARTILLRGDAECKRLARWYIGDVAGKKLALAARKECIASKAGSPTSGTAQAAAAEHFDREGEHRERAHDRAVQINEGWQNRAAMDRNTRAIRNIGRTQFIARDSLGRPIIPYRRWQP